METFTIVFVLATCLAGWFALALTMTRHMSDLLGRPPARRERIVLKSASAALFVAAIAACLSHWGVALGPVAWIGALSATGAALAFLLPWLPAARRR